MKPNDRNFAVSPSVQQLREMVAPDAVDIPCDDSGEAEIDDPRCSECERFPCICDGPNGVAI